MDKNNLSKIIVIVVLISLVVGGISGVIAGFYTANLTMNNEAPALYSFLYQKLFPSFKINQELGEEVINKEPIDLDSGKPPEIIKEIVKSDESDAVMAVAKVSPSVVSIVVSKYVRKYYGSYSPQPSDYFFDDFFGSNWPFNFSFERGPGIPTPIPSPEEGKLEKREVGGGTGFVISSDQGLILTNKHVVSDTEATYTIVSNDGEKYAAEVLSRDPFNDMAILKIKNPDFNLPEVKLGDSDQLKIGQTVIAIGNALGEYRNTVTKGVISGISRRVVAGDATGRSEILENVIQTDAAINFGNSGGPLINLQGEVIGINTAISQQGQLISFAIPINQAKVVVESVEKYGRIVRPFLGIRYILINEQIAKVNNLSINYGALIIRGRRDIDLAVIPGSPANKAGLVENDIILELNGEKITEERSLAKEIQKYKPGDAVELKVLHQGEEKTVTAVLEEYQAQ
ncbi:trypsin-like peptidase domain-containing protein [Patescibacteria group bacterium]|nr:trypsin-like peptidase domain-containing protein [Patescibacteria group bacterium]